MNLTNKLGCLRAYFEAVKNQCYKPKSDRLGVTELVTSPQIRRLYIEHYEEITADVADFFERMLGTAWHKYLEKYIQDTGGRAEVKYEVKLEDITLVGKTDAVYDDIVEVTEQGIHDHKLVKSFALSRKVRHENLRKWTEQLNIYNWLRYKVEGKQSKNLIIIAYIKDWSSTDKQRQNDYPDKIEIIYLPVWPLEKTEEFINQRLALYKDKNYQCTDDDKWIRPEGSAVMQQGRKNALAATKVEDGKRVNMTDVDCFQWIQENSWLKEYQSGKVYIDHRVSQPRNCQEFCKVRSVCPFAKGLKKGEKL